MWNIRNELYHSRNNNENVVVFHVKTKFCSPEFYEMKTETTVLNYIFVITACVSCYFIWWFTFCSFKVQLTGLCKLKPEKNI